MCEPQNVALKASEEDILLTWQDDPSCSALHDVLTYELQVLSADKLVDKVRAHTPTVTLEEQSILQIMNLSTEQYLNLSSSSV